ncbi:MAG: alpha/beta hydrolase [Actinomycetota bacterium]|nr:alpha/beta hydrolase [Actinomycetota bacterium]
MSERASEQPTIVFIHGAWVTPLCWDEFAGYFSERGYACIAPPWPGKEGGVEALRVDPSALAGLGIAEIVDHYESIVRDLPAPPVLIGHSFGGLFVQLLLDRGLGAAGVAIDSAPPRGVNGVTWSSLRSLGSVLRTWRGWRKVVRWSFPQFRYAFVHTLPEEEARAAYERHVTPETGRVFFQAALAPVNPRSPARINFDNATRAPLLLVAGELDRIVPAKLNRANHRKYTRPAARTDLISFPGRTHWIIAQDGWEEVAGAIHDWLGALDE